MIRVADSESSDVDMYGLLSFGPDRNNRVLIRVGVVVKRIVRILVSSFYLLFGLHFQLTVDCLKELFCDVFEASTFKCSNSSRLVDLIAAMQVIDDTRQLKNF
jgi:hypothetical protein